MGKTFFSSWSGGKDSCLALYKELKRGGELELLFSVFRGSGEKSGSHGLKRDIIEAQGRSLDTRSKIETANWGEYKDALLSCVKYSESIGINRAVFGDIDLVSHRDWLEDVLFHTNTEAVFPLWGMDRESVVREFIDSGFEAIVVACDREKMSKKDLGRKIDHGLIDEFKERGIDPAGENGEYHTLVIDGPIFSERIDIRTSQIYSSEKSFFLSVEK